MRRVEFAFRSSDQKTQIHAIKWEPDKKPCAIIQIAHGMSEYLARYENFAKVLTSCGILVVGNDHLGHGGSVLSVNELGYFADKDGELCITKDLYRLGEMVRSAYPNIPYFLFGHSMGSFFVRRYMCEYNRNLDGVILSGTGYVPSVSAKAGMALSKTMKSVRGWHYRSKTVNDLITGKLNVPFQPARTPKDWLSRDEAVVDAYIKDPRCGFLFTLNGCYNFFKVLDQIDNSDLLKNMNKDVSVLFISGGDDPVGHFGTDVRKVAADFREAGMKQVDCIIYPHYRHEILNELGKETVYKDVLKWIAGILGSENI